MRDFARRMKCVLTNCSLDSSLLHTFLMFFLCYRSHLHSLSPSAKPPPQINHLFALPPCQLFGQHSGALRTQDARILQPSLLASCQKDSSPDSSQWGLSATATTTVTSSQTATGAPLRILGCHAWLQGSGLCRLAGKAQAGWTFPHKTSVGLPQLSQVKKGGKKTAAAHT